MDTAPRSLIRRRGAGRSPRALTVSDDQARPDRLHSVVMGWGAADITAVIEFAGAIGGYGRTVRTG